MKKEKTIAEGNGQDAPKDAIPIEIPVIMANADGAKELINKLREETKASQQNTISLDKYHVTEGMQNEEKIPFFTEFTSDDDVLRINTIEAYNTVSLLCIKKASEKNMKRIQQLNKDIYDAHAKTHKRNMVSKLRKREDAYIRILSADSSDSGAIPTGFKKFFGIGGKK